MNYLKRFFFVVVIFVILSTIISLFLPSHNQFEQSIIIDNDEEVVSNQIKRYQLTKLLNYDVRKEDFNWQYHTRDNGVELEASINISFGFNPMTKFSALFAKKEINQALEKQLDSLKVFIENLPKIHSVKVEQKVLDKTIWFLSIRDTVNPNEMNNIQGKIYEEIGQYISQNEINESDSPIVIYHLFTQTIIDIEAGIPISDSVEIKDNRIQLRKIVPQNVVTAIHYGPYDRMPETYFGINEWMRNNKVVVTGVPWEQYLTNPVEENNPEKWQTAIFFPIE